MTDLLTDRVHVPATVLLATPGANGAPPNQPGAAPQIVKERKPGEG